MLPLGGVLAKCASGKGREGADCFQELGHSKKG